MFISEHCFIELSKRQIKRLKDPSVAFVDTIKNILLEIVDYCTSKIVEQEKNRFPRLYKRINKVACDAVNERLQPTKEFVEKIVNMQLNYINIRHPEFDLTKIMNSNNPNNENSEIETRQTRSSTVDIFDEPPVRINTTNRRNFAFEQPAPPPQPDIDIDRYLESLRNPSVPSRTDSLANNAPPQSDVQNGVQQLNGYNVDDNFDADQQELDDCRKLRKFFLLFCKKFTSIKRKLLPW